MVVVACAVLSLPLSQPPFFLSSVNVDFVTSLIHIRSQMSARPHPAPHQPVLYLKLLRPNKVVHAVCIPDCSRSSPAPGGSVAPASPPRPHRGWGKPGPSAEFQATPGPNRHPLAPRGTQPALKDLGDGQQLSTQHPDLLSCWECAQLPGGPAGMGGRNRGDCPPYVCGWHRAASCPPLEPRAGRSPARKAMHTPGELLPSALASLPKLLTRRGGERPQHSHVVSWGPGTLEECQGEGLWVLRRSPLLGPTACPSQAHTETC